MSDKTVYGFCWYKPEQWQRLREIDEHPEALDDTYEQWRKSAHQAISDLQAQGIKIKKVSIDLEEFLTWCDERSSPINSESRSEYVVYLLETKYIRNDQG